MGIIYANITISTDSKNSDLDEEYMKTLTREKKVNYINKSGKDTAKRIQLKGVVLPSNDLKLINDTCLKRIAKQADLDHKKIKVISVDKFRIINGDGIYLNDWTKTEV